MGEFKRTIFMDEYSAYFSLFYGPFGTNWNSY